VTTSDRDRTRKRVFLYWIGSFVLAAVVFIFFPLITALYSVQLRELSTVIAEFFLKMLTFSVTRQGTILSLPGMVFNVVPACSGSTTIRVLVAMGVLWSGIHMGLSPLRKIILAALSLPIALVANGMRVALLVWASYLSGTAISEGLLHTLIGAFGFVVAMTAFFALGQFLVGCNRGADGHAPINCDYGRDMLVFTVLLLFLAYLPFFAACIKAWKGAVFNTNDLYGYILFIAAAAAWIWAWRKFPENYNAAVPGLVVFSLVTLLAILSQATGPNNYMLGLTFLGTLFSVGMIYRGAGFAVRAVPVYLVFFLSYPKVTEFINDLLHLNGFAQPFAIKIVLSFIALVLFYRLIVSARFYDLPGPARRVVFAGMTIMAFLFFSSQVMFVQRDFTAMAGNYSFPYFITDNGVWQGRDVADPAARLFYERENNIVRHYEKAGKAVGIMIIPSDGNRKKIHTPEYCQTGLGWQVKSKGYITFSSESGRKIRARKLTLVHPEKNIIRTFIYWFSDGRNAYADYPMFLLVDTLRKLIFHNENWLLFVVWSDAGEDVAADFLSGLPEVRQ